MMTRFFTLPRERSQFLHCCGTVCRQQRAPGHTAPACAQCAPAPDTHFRKDLSAKNLFEIAKVQKPPTVFPVCFCEPFDRSPFSQTFSSAPRRSYLIFTIPRAIPWQNPNPTTKIQTTPTRENLGPSPGKPHVASRSRRC